MATETKSAHEQEQACSTDHTEQEWAVLEMKGKGEEHYLVC